MQASARGFKGGAQRRLSPKEETTHFGGVLYSVSTHIIPEMGSTKQD
jgi:hypothetical protein